MVPPLGSASGVAAYRHPEPAVDRGKRALEYSDPDKPDELLASLAALTMAKHIAGDLEGAIEEGEYDP